MKLFILGTGAAIPSTTRDNTSLFLKVGTEKILVDCPGSVPYKINNLKEDFTNITRVFISHLHIDHVYGLPSLLHCMWLKGRKTDLTVYGPVGTRDAVVRMMETLSLSKKPGFFKIKIIQLSEKEGRFVNTDHIELSCLGVDHGLPTLGLRIKDKIRNTSITYSSDTAPCENVIKLAMNSDILVHESTYPDEFVEEGHSTAGQAGEIASRSNVKKLILVHLDAVCEGKEEILRKQAQSKFSGQVIIPKDYDVFEV